MTKFNLNEFVQFEWTELHYFIYEIDIEIASFNTYIEENQKLILKHQRAFETKIKNDENLDPKWEYYGSYIQHHYQFEEEVTFTLSKIHNYSTFLSIMAFAESKLYEVCILVNTKLNLNISVDELHGRRDLLNKYWSYLKIEAGFNLDGADKSFSKIKKFQKLRNNVAHKNGVISQNMRKFVTDTKGIELSKYGNQVVISNIEFLKNILISIEEFFDSLSKCINENIVGIK